MSYKFSDEKFVNEFEFKVNQIKNIEKEAIQKERQRLKKLLNNSTHWMYYDSRHWVMRDMILEFLEDKK